MASNPNSLFTFLSENGTVGCDEVASAERQKHFLSEYPVPIAGSFVTFESYEGQSFICLKRLDKGKAVSNKSLMVSPSNYWKIGVGHAA
jgi:hypothetical protein